MNVKICTCDLLFFFSAFKNDIQSRHQGECPAFTSVKNVVLSIVLLLLLFYVLFYYIYLYNVCICVQDRGNHGTIYFI